MRNQLKLILYLLIVLNILSWSLILEKIYFRDKVAFLNVGQADSEIILNKAGNILIDAGSKRAVKEIEDLLPFFDKTIDVFILSHPDRDHFLGFFEILDNFKVRLTVLPNFNQNESLYQQLLNEIKNKNIKTIILKTPIKISLGQEENLLVFSTESLKQKNQSQNSLVSFYNFKNFKFLFPGDIDQYLENQLIPVLKSLAFKIDVLKVAHHGSKYSSSKLFLDNINPTFSVIETGDNSYGHPHQETLDRLKEIGSKVLRTDLDGTVIFLIKNNELIYNLKKGKI